MEDKSITLGGRKFRPLTSSTLERDHYLMARVIKAGVVRMTLEHGELPAEFVERVMAALIVSGTFIEILGGLVLPAEMEDHQWSPELAIKQAQMIAHLTTDEDKATIRSITVQLLLSFLKGGLISLYQGAPPSSTKEGNQSAETNQSPTHGMGSSLAH